MPEREIRKMQDKVSKDVDERQAETERLIKESKKDRDFREASEHEGMDKGALIRSNRAKR